MIEHYIHSGHSQLSVDFVYEETNYGSLAVEAFECAELVVFYRDVLGNVEIQLIKFVVIDDTGDESNVLIRPKESRKRK